MHSVVGESNIVLTLNDYYIREFVQDALASFYVPKGLLLDLGCGLRPYQKLYEGNKWQSIAVDIHSTSLADIIADACNLPFYHCTFECILCFEVLEHINNFDRAISEIARLLKPGGILVITWPFIYGMHDIPHDHYRFSEYAMEKNLKRHGLTIIQMRRRGDCLGVLHTMIGQYGCSAIKALTRIPWVGAALKPLHFAIQWLTQMTYWFHYTLSHHSFRHKLSAAGDGLKSIPGSLSLWNLGYCAIARKDESICKL